MPSSPPAARNFKSKGTAYLYGCFCGGCSLQLSCFRDFGECWGEWWYFVWHFLCNFADMANIKIRTRLCQCILRIKQCCMSIAGIHYWCICNACLNFRVLRWLCKVIRRIVIINEIYLAVLIFFKWKAHLRGVNHAFPLKNMPCLCAFRAICN